MSDETLSTRTRTGFALLGAGVLAAAAAGVALGASPSYAGSTYLTATFARAGQGLDPGKSDVKIRGIAVGTVAGVSLGRDGRVTVRMRLDKGVRVARTATAGIEPVSVFGPKDLTLDLGSGETTGPYLPDGGRIGRTTDPEEISDTAWPTYRLTAALDPDEVATIVHTFSAGLSGEGPALRRTVGNLATVVDATHQDRNVLRGLIDDVTGLSGTLATRGGTLTGAVADANKVAPVVYTRPDKVSALLDEAGKTAGTVSGTLDRQGGHLGHVVDSAAGVAATVNAQRGNIPTMIDGLNGFFNLLADIIRTKGPQGTELAQARDTLSLDLCRTLVDICPPGFSMSTPKVNP
ncbi:MCE family protein [Actinomadura atramentaria]|uniref:MCE family protein n=1 Tax=Actinomadura atramentaria TaxID=1990 RepID=UPI00037F586F|nr:MCE family protein [Actinomadura atramentaria]